MFMPSSYFPRLPPPQHVGSRGVEVKCGANHVSKTGPPSPSTLYIKMTRSTPGRVHMVAKPVRVAPQGALDQARRHLSVTHPLTTAVVHDPLHGFHCTLENGFHDGVRGGLPEEP